MSAPDDQGLHRLRCLRMCGSPFYRATLALHPREYSSRRRRRGCVCRIWAPGRSGANAEVGAGASTPTRATAFGRPPLSTRSYGRHVVANADCPRLRAGQPGTRPGHRCEWPPGDRDGRPVRRRRVMEGHPSPLFRLSLPHEHGLPASQTTRRLRSCSSSVNPVRTRRSKEPAMIDSGPVEAQEPKFAIRSLDQRRSSTGSKITMLSEQSDERRLRRAVAERDGGRSRSSWYIPPRRSRPFTIRMLMPRAMAGPCPSPRRRRRRQWPTPSASVRQCLPAGPVW